MVEGIFLVAGYCAVCCVVLGSLYATAPYGWEDEDGFHYGKRDEP